jgi:hypothetical protein
MKSGWSLPGAVVDLAVSYLPADRADWAAAMRAELKYTSDRRSAWLWALGCLRAGLSIRFLEKSLLDHGAVRWLLSLWLAFRVEDCVCDVALVLSYKVPSLGLQRLLGHCAQGEDYQGLIPLFDATTYGSLGAWLFVSALYVLVIVSLLRRTSHAAHLFIVAAALSIALWVCELGEPLFVGAFSLTELLLDALLYIGTALLGWMCWADMRRQSRPTL